MFYPYKKGNGEWTNTVPLNQEQTPYTPLWSSGDGYQTNNLFIFRASDQTVTTTAAYQSAQVLYNIAVEDNTTWFNTATGVWTPQVAGWWQITAGASNSAGANGENIISLSGAAYASSDTVGLADAVVFAFGYFNGKTSSCQVNVATGVATPVSHPQSPTTSFFQALYLRP